MALNRRRLVLAGACFSMPAIASGQSAQRALAAGETLRGKFVQLRNLKGFERPLKSTGDFVLAQGRGLIWRTETPFPVVTVITPAGLVQEVDGREAMRIASGRLPFLARLYDMFSASLAGNWTALENQFDVARGGDNRNWTIVLTPRPGVDPAALPIRTVTLRGSTYLDEAQIEKPDGDWDRLSFTDQIVGSAPISAAEATLFAQAAR